ncbi:MAG: hypothetical protein AAFX94_23965 [Myxococcota bacterium]
MSDGPENDPLGARPVLPVPKGAPAKRAREMFSAYLAETRAHRTRSHEPPPPAPEPAQDPPAPRRYDLALSILLAESAAPPPASAAEVETSVTPEPEAREPLARPPVGSPAVRPTVPPRPALEAIDQSLLESVADNALLHQGPDGTSAFEISFNDDVFTDLGCTIQFDAGAVVATFRAVDSNTRRLLESEAGRLRVRLEDRGLRVKEVRVLES